MRRYTVETISENGYIKKNFTTAYALHFAILALKYFFKRGAAYVTIRRTR